MNTNELPDFAALVQAAYERCQALCGELDALDGQLPTDVGALEPLQKYLTDAREAAATSRASLAAPQLHIAFVGTTKAGKSTMVNGFIGRRLAPMESEEMSAGLLELVEGAWSARAMRGVLTISDSPCEAEIYESLKESMTRVVADRRERGDDGKPRPQPVYEVRAPLFPNMSQHDFADFTKGRLPVKVFDLPGLRTANDPENFNVIRAHIGSALSVVVIDRNQMANRETQAQLLEQLNEVVADLGGRTTLMLFLLNKSDTRNTDDQPINEEQRKAEAMIRRRLNLESSPESVVAVPVSGLLYYWGARLLVALAEERDADAQAMRAPILGDCWKGLELYFDADKRPVRVLRRTLEDDVDVEALTDRNVLVNVGILLLKAAGHDDLWRGIKRRVGLEAPTMLVYPHVSKALRLSRDVAARIKSFADAQRIESEARLVAAESQLAALEERVRDRLAETEAYYAESTQLLVDACASAGGGTAKVTQIVRGRFSSTGELRGLSGLQPLLSDIKASLRKELIVPVTSALAKKAPSRDLLAAVTGRADAREQLRSAYEELKDLGYDKFAANGHHKQYKKSAIATREEKEIEEYKKMQAAMADLFLALRRIMTARAESILRSQGRHVAADIDALVRESAIEAWHRVVADVSREWGDADAFLRDRLTSFDVRAVDLDVDRQIQLPESVVKVPEPNFATEAKEKESYMKTVYKDPKASCFKGETKTVATREVDVTIIDIMSAAVIEERLVTGIDGAIEDIWARMSSWISACVKQSLEALRRIFEGQLSAIREGIAHRRQTLRDATEKTQTRWALVSEHADRVHTQERELARLAGAHRVSVA